MNEQTSTLVAAAVTGVVVTIATNLGMKAYDKIKAKRVQKKATKTN
jgi:hypothetical protein